MSHVLGWSGSVVGHAPTTGSSSEGILHWCYTESVVRTFRWDMFSYDSARVTNCIQVTP